MQYSYDLILATRNNISLDNNDFIFYSILASIEHLLHKLKDVAQITSNARRFISDYHKERQNLVYRADIYDDLDDGLSSHENSYEQEYAYNESIILKFDDRVYNIITSIFNLLIIKFQLDGNLILIEKVFNDSKISAFTFAAACSGLSIKDFCDLSFEELHEYDLLDLDSWQWDLKRKIYDLAIKLSGIYSNDLSKYVGLYKKNIPNNSQLKNIKKFQLFNFFTFTNNAEGNNNNQPDNDLDDNLPF